MSRFHVPGKIPHSSELEESNRVAVPSSMWRGIRSTWAHCKHFSATWLSRMTGSGSNSADVAPHLGQRYAASGSFDIDVVLPGARAPYSCFPPPNSRTGSPLAFASATIVRRTLR